MRLRANHPRRYYSEIGLSSCRARRPSMLSAVSASSQFLVSFFVLTFLFISFLLQPATLKDRGRDKWGFVNWKLFLNNFDWAWLGVLLEHHLLHRVRRLTSFRLHCTGLDYTDWTLTATSSRHLAALTATGLGLTADLIWPWLATSRA